MSIQSICREKIEALAAFETNDADQILKERALKLSKKLTALESKELKSETVVALLDALHNFQRIMFMYHAKLDSEKILEMDGVATDEKSWRNLQPLQVDRNLRKSLAGRLIHGAFQHIPGGDYPNEPSDQPPQDKEKTIMIASPDGRGTAEYVAAYMLKHDIPFEIDFTDWFFKKKLKEISSLDEVESFANYNASKYNTCKKRISVSSNAPKAASEDQTSDKTQVYDKALHEFKSKLSSGEVFYTLTYIPTPEDAKIDGIAYPEYLKLFFELCDQPWAEIQRANKKLIDQLEHSKTIHFIDPDTGTDLSMRVEGKKWANSLVLKNIPGSEVFASPIKNSVNGTLKSEGRFRYKQGEVIEDISLTFKDGKVVDFDARVGREELRKIIEMDDDDPKHTGSRFVGEIGIGTNPWLKRHVMNDVLVEKISGSFHIALGDAYKYRNYDNKEVQLDNRNRSIHHVHWDITTMMQRPNAKIVLDDGPDHEGKVIMQGGKFVGEGLEVLNEGWAAVPNRPPRWEKLIKQALVNGQAVQ